MSIEHKTRGELSPNTLSSIKQALEEDVGSGDITTDPIISEGAQASGHIVAKQSGVVAGLTVAEAVFRLIDQNMAFSAKVAEGARVERGTS